MNEIKQLLINLQNNILQYNKTNFDNIKQMQSLLLPLIERVDKLELDIQLIKNQLLMSSINQNNVSDISNNNDIDEFDTLDEVSSDNIASLNDNNFSVKPHEKIDDDEWKMPNS